MLRVGLTGGIGSGKSTVAAALARRGGLLIDADLIAREVVEPDGPAYAPLVARFGHAVLQPDGTLDRPALAAQVFADPPALADLNRITHPVIGAVVLARADELAAHAVESGHDDAVIVFDLPLLTKASAEVYRLDVVVVVDTPTDVAVTRLVSGRGFSEADARARIATQMDREERLAFADVVIDNTGDVAGLDRQVDRAWQDLRARSQG